VVAFSGDGSAATVTLPAGFSGNFDVAVTIGACNAGDASKRMTKTISSRPSAPVIALTSGTTSCKTDLAAFTLSYQVQTGTNYLWRIPSGWQISPAGANVGTGISYPSAGLQTVTITPTNTNADNVSVTAKFPNGSGCGASEVASNSIQVTYQLTSANTINISSTGCLAPGSSVNLAVGGTSSNTSIQWSLPAGWAITSANPNDNSITASVGTAGGTITASAVGCPGTVSRAVTVSGNGGCNPSSFAVERGSTRYFYITDLTNPSNPSPTCLPDGLGANPSPITYTWTAGNQTRTVVGGSSEVIFPIAVPSGTNVSVRIQNTLTCLDYVLTGSSLRPLGNRQPSTAKRAASSSLSSYPNPAQDELNVDLTLPAGGEAQLFIVDLLGRTVQQSATRQEHTQVNVKALPKGTYLLRAILPDGKSISQKIQVQR